MKLYTESELDELEEREAREQALLGAEAMEDGMRHYLDEEGHVTI